MAKFISERVFNLGFLGDEWKDCFLVFSSVTIKEFRALTVQKLQSKSPTEVTDISVAFLKEHFIRGSVFDSDAKAIVPLKLDELEEMPSLIQEKAILFLVGGANQ